ncbi:unnamed protein product [Prunus armeniaca]|uniref:GAG-pre-integrase domain-containing protein n=1 Tax=Prunus armeniaca TaxID=36596 RepID=A0A6J5VAD9_PRUAR|nr:unnamed protein product [Prunus armeniaca]
MNIGTKANVTEARAYLTNERKYKGKHPNLKCQHCNYPGHVKETCWILHPELKPDFMKENKGSQRLNRTTHRANHASVSIFNGSDTLKNFTANPTALINEFASYLQSKNGGAGSNHTTSIEDGNSSALLGKFAGFLADTEHIPQQDMQGIMNAFKTALNDCVTKKTIGEGFYLDGLYYISKSNPRVFQTKSTSLQDSQLWHQRLAHPSQPILSTLFPNLGKDSISCETCHMSKATRLPFSSSLSRAKPHGCTF